MQAVKLVLVGDHNVGKTTILITYQSKATPKSEVPRVLDNFDSVELICGKPISLGLWDTNSSEDYDRLRPLSYPQTDLFIVCFSVDSFSSFQNVSSKWKPEIQKGISYCPMVLLGTKTDLRNDKGAIERLREQNASPISAEQGMEKAEEIGAYKYFECSSHDVESVQKAIYGALRSIVGPPDHMMKKSKNSCVIL